VIPDNHLAVKTALMAVTWFASYPRFSTFICSGSETKESEEQTGLDLGVWWLNRTQKI